MPTNSSATTIPDTARCSHCKLDKPLSDFYRDKSRPLGVANFCRPCHRASTAPWQTLHPDRLAAYSRHFREVHRDELNAARRARNVGRVYTAEEIARLDEWRHKNPERSRIAQKAAGVLHTAIRNGKVVRGTQCEDCGATDRRIEAAHYDYDRPLKVRWLCRSCHVRWDAAEPKTLRAVAS